MTPHRLQTNASLVLPLKGQTVVAARDAAQIIHVQQIIYSPTTYDSTLVLLFRDSVTRVALGQLSGLNAPVKRRTTQRILDFRTAGAPLSIGANLDLIVVAGVAAGTLQVIAYQTPGAFLIPTIHGPFDPLVFDPRVFQVAY